MAGAKTDAVILEYAKGAFFQLCPKEENPTPPLAATARAVNERFGTDFSRHTVSNWINRYGWRDEFVELIKAGKANGFLSMVIETEGVLAEEELRARINGLYTDIADIGSNTIKIIKKLQQDALFNKLSISQTIAVAQLGKDLLRDSKLLELGIQKQKETHTVSFETSMDLPNENQCPAS